MTSSNYFKNYYAYAKNFSSSASSRRNSITKLPWPEPSPVRDLPPAAPKPKIKHYPLPPPRYEEGMIALSRRLRNRSASPAPNYSELELSNRPALVPAALGRPSPSREMIRMTMCGPPLRQYNYGRNIWERLRVTLYLKYIIKEHETERKKEMKTANKWGKDLINWVFSVFHTSLIGYTEET